MGKSSGQTTTQQTSSKPWNKDILKDANQGAFRLIENDIGYKPFEAPTYAPFSQQTLQGLQRTQDLASSGSPIVDNATSSISNTLAGGNLNGNPYLMDALKGGADQIALRSNMSAAGAGRYGSAAAARGTADALSNYYSNALMQNYGQERDRQMQAATMAPQMEALRYSPAQALMGVGSAYEGKTQQAIDDAMQRWNLNEARPWEQLSRLNALLTGSGALGGTQTTRQPAASPLGQLLGYGMMGSSILGNVGRAGLL